MTVVDDKVTAVDLSKIVMVKSNNPKKEKEFYQMKTLPFRRQGVKGKSEDLTLKRDKERWSSGL